MVLFIISMFLVGCGSSSSDSFRGRIDHIQANEFVVNCTDAVKKGQRDSDDMAHLCHVQITEETMFLSENGEALTASDFSAEAETMVEVVLTKSVNFRKRSISKDPSVLTAKEIILLSRERVTSEEQVVDALKKQGLRVQQGEKDPNSGAYPTLRGVEPSIYRINDKEVLLYTFESEEEQRAGWGEYMVIPNKEPIKNYNADSVLLIFKYDGETRTKVTGKIQRAFDELMEY
jgi:hypothetical protein